MNITHTGMTDAQVAASRTQWGSNALTPQASETFLDKLLGNFKDPTIIVLMVALVMISVLAAFGQAVGTRVSASPWRS